MKTKKVCKRLMLNKVTVTHLNGQDMNTVKGGSATVCTCPPGCKTTYPLESATIQC